MTQDLQNAIDTTRRLALTLAGSVLGLCEDHRLKQATVEQVEALDAICAALEEEEAMNAEYRDRLAAVESRMVLLDQVRDLVNDIDIKLHEDLYGRVFTALDKLYEKGYFNEELV